MTYATQSALEARFGVDELVQITNPTDPAATVVNPTRVDEAITDIDALIDAKLQRRYQLPLATVPTVLRNIACDLVRARLYEDRITEHVANRERAALKLLDEVRDGGITLGLAEAEQPPAVSGSGPVSTEPNRVFSRDTLRDYTGG